MKVIPIKTPKITADTGNLLSVLGKYLPTLKERSVLAITSKIVSICEGSTVRAGKIAKEELVRQEAQYYIPPEESKYNITLTIKNNFLIPTAGIDESNGNGYYILWPKNSQRSANRIRKYLSQRFKLKKVGVIITDSKTTPLRWGTTGVGIAASGFAPLKNYIGKPDLFRKKLRVTKANILDGLASAAVAVMGEGDEQTPLAVISDVPFITFQQRNPTQKELRDLKIDISEDLYAPLLTRAPWHKGHKAKGDQKRR